MAAGRVYIGAESGGFYALKEATGAVVWSRQLDTEPNTTCPARGITSTAAVKPDPVTGTSTVYVSGARYLYALNAATGAVVWKTEIGPPSLANPDAYYNWSSPTVAGGHIYTGLSSSCDNPLIRGGLVELDQHTGQVCTPGIQSPADRSAAASGRAPRLHPAAAMSGYRPETNAIPPSTAARPATSSGTRCRSCTCPRRWPCSRRGPRREPPGRAMTGTSAPHRPCSAAAARRPTWAPATRTAAITHLPPTRWAAPHCGQT